MTEKWTRFVDLFMTGIFALGAAVQYNDPDPARWMAIYGLAALAAFLAFTRRLHAFLPLAIGAIALVWAMMILPGVSGKVLPGEIFASVEMKSEPVEEMREGLGLLIIAGWMGILALRAHRARRAQ